MLTLTFAAAIATKGLALVPTVFVDYSDKNNGTVDLLFCWLCGTLGVTINWAHDAKK